MSGRIFSKHDNRISYVVGRFDVAGITLMVVPGIKFEKEPRFEKLYS